MNSKTKSTLLLVLLIITFIICSTLVLAISFKESESNAVYADPEHTHDGWTAWSNSASLPSSVGSYYLTTNVTASSGWTVPTGEVHLCLNDHSITLGDKIIVGDGCTLNIYDDGTTSHYYTGYNAVYKGNYNYDYYYGNVADESTYNSFAGYKGIFTGGYINPTDSNKDTGLIRVNNGTLNIYSGTLVGSGTGITLYGNNVIVNVFGGNFFGMASAIWTESGTPTIYVSGGLFSANGGNITYTTGTVTAYLSGGRFEKQRWNSINIHNVYISGSLYVEDTDNHNALIVPYGSALHLMAPLTENAHIDIYVYANLNNGVFTDGWTTYMGDADPNDYFRLSTQPNCLIEMEGDEAAAKTAYTITYDANGADSGDVPTAITRSSGTDITVSSNTGNLQKAGKFFGGWNTMANGTGDNYFAGDSLVVTENKTLYAKWTDDPTVTITAGTGVLSVYTSETEDATSGNPNGYAYSNGTMVYGFAVLKPGYEAPSEWTQIGESTSYRVTDATIINNEPVDLGAFNATASVYTVTFNMQGGTSETTQIQATYDAEMPNITIPTKTYCGFLGYFDQETGGTKYYNADGTSAKIWDKTEDSTLYAQWATGVNSVVAGTEYTWNNSAHTIASITFYDAVTSEELTGGTLKYYDGSAYTLDEAPEYTNAGTYDIKYEYIKDGYATKYETIVLTINKADLQITLPTAITGNVYSNIDYDLINAGSVDYGTLYYAVNVTNEVPEETAFTIDIPTAKSAGTYYVFYKANGDDNHNPYVASSNEAIVVTIAKADLAEDQYTIPTGLQATYGDLLSSVTLTNGWAWKNPTNTVGNAGNAVNEAIYTPEDSVNFNTIEESLTITVSKANPTYTAPTNIEAPYGATLSTVVLPEGFAWMDGTQKVDNWEANTFKARYTPADTANYNVIENIDVQVAIKWIIVDPDQDTVNVEIDDGETNFDVSITVKVEVKTELSVEAKQTNYANLAKGFVAKDEDISAIYGVKLIRTTNGVEEEIQPSDIKEGQKIKISMAIPEALQGKEFRLLHIHSAEDISEVSKENYAISADGKTLIIETDKLSEFAFVSKTDKADNGFIYDEPSTGFKYWWIIVIVAVVLIICLLLFIFFKRKKDNDDDSNKTNEQPEVEAEKELEDAKEDTIESIEAKEKAHEAITLKDSLTLAKATSSSHEFSKKYVADYLRTKDIVEVNERENFTKTGLPLADTHYVDGKEGKKCFAYVYETEGSIILLAKMDDEYAKSLQKNHSQINKSAFPKQKNTWYSLIIDDTYSKEEFEDILDELIGEVKEDAGMSLKESIALAKASTAHSFSKKYVCEYLKDKENVEVNERENFTRTGLPLADTHYVIKGDKKICFAYIYEIEGSIILLAKMNTQYAKELQKKHSNVTLSAFPKQADTWYSLIIDDTYSKEEFEKILDDIREQA